MLTEWVFTTDDQGALSLDECLQAGAKGVMISNEHYHQLPGISGSSLIWLAESNRHYDNRHLFGSDADCFTFGSLVHTLILEPDTVTKRYVIKPKFDTRTSLGKSETIAFHQAHENMTVIDENDWQKAQKMARNVMAIAGDVIDAGIKERSLFAKHQGLVIKSRLDIDHIEQGDDYDLKTITLGQKAFNDRTIEQHIVKYKYHWAAALRNLVKEELGLPNINNYLIFVETGAPHRVRMIQIDRYWISEATHEIKEMLDDRLFYLATGRDKPIKIIQRGSYYE